MGLEWEVEKALEPELESVRKCMPDRILFLNASEDVLRRHKEMDRTRSREFFEYYLTHLLPLKRDWFFNRPAVDILNVESMNSSEVGERVKEWVDSCYDKK